MARSSKTAPVAGPSQGGGGSHSLPGLTLIEPYQQGEFDGLCGVYAIVNGLRLLVAPLRPLSYEECAVLYGRGIEIVRREDRLAFAATFGISQTLWRRLAAALCVSAGRIVGLALRPVQPFAMHSHVPSTRVLAAVHAALDAGSPVLVALRGAYDVIGGYTLTRLILHDSYAYCWVGKGSCGVSHDRSDKRHKIATRSIIILELW